MIILYRWQLKFEPAFLKKVAKYANKLLTFVNLFINLTTVKNNYEVLTKIINTLTISSFDRGGHRRITPPPQPDLPCPHMSAIPPENPMPSPFGHWAMGIDGQGRIPQRVEWGGLTGDQNRFSKYLVFSFSRRVFSKSFKNIVQGSKLV